MEDFSALEKFIKLGMARKYAGVDLSLLPDDIPSDARWLCERNTEVAKDWIKNPQGRDRQILIENATAVRHSVNSRNLVNKRDDGDIMELVERHRGRSRLEELSLGIDIPNVA